MAKRQSHADAGPTTRKKRKVTVVHEAPTSEEVHTSRQLVKLLAFDQDLKKARHGLQSFKVLLDSIANEDDDAAEKLRILEEYLQSAKPKAKAPAGEAVYLPEIMETWSFASQLNNDNVMSAVAVVLALVLRIASKRLQLVGHGLGIGRTVLQKARTELLAKNLSADKGKEFVISPTLRLLREALCLDGGTLASAIFRARNQTFTGLVRNLGIRYLGDGVETTSRPSARTNAVRFVLSALKYLHRDAKRELLAQREIITGITRFIKDDPPHLIPEIFGTLKDFVLLDDQMPRESKSRLLTIPTLNRIASLYGYDQRGKDEGAASIPDLAHDFLLLACTTPSAGILRSQGGIYPQSSNDGVSVPQSLHNGLAGTGEQRLWMDRFKDDIPVHNVVLSEFIQSLRPWSSLKQSELVVAVFTVAPELVAKYFLEKKTFSFEPKLSATWIGYASFLFATLQLPVPPFFGHQPGYSSLPPSTSIVLDNVIPTPLNQKVLSRCLSVKSNLASFFASRLLILSLGKLQTVLAAYDDAARHGEPAWRVARRELLHEFCQRAPPMKEIINAYRAIPESDLLHQEAATALLRLYYETIPQVAVASKFDVAPYLVSAIEQLEGNQIEGQDRSLSLMRLKNLLATARSSPGVRWFVSGKNNSGTLFTAVMRAHIDAGADVSLDESSKVLGFVAQEHQLVVPKGDSERILPYLESLKALQLKDPPMGLDSVFLVLDKAAAHCASSPLKYLNMIQDLLAEGSAEAADSFENIDPFLMALVEQLPFLVKQLDSRAIDAVFSYLSELAALLINHYPQSKSGLRLIFAKMEEAMPEGSPNESMTTIFDRDAGAKRYREAKHVIKHLVDIGPPEPSSASFPVVKGEEASMGNMLQRIHSDIDVDVDNGALTRWTSKSIDELVDDGHVTRLIRLLASSHESIRKEALTNLRKLAQKVRESDYDENEQVWLLLSEVAESTKDIIAAEPVPWAIVAFACHCLGVLKSPLHPLYGKVNTFLTKGPTWSLDRLPLVREILLEEPAGDDTYYKEVSWLLSYLLDALQDSRDLAIFHKRRVYEKLCGLVTNPYARSDLKMQVFRILYRTTDIKDGSTTLITRLGIVSWLEALASMPDGEEEAILSRALLARTWDTCDQERVSAWSKGGINDVAVHHI